MYLLKGRKTWLAWCRDRASDWKSELADGTPPAALRGLTLDLNPPEGVRCRTYDPWTDRWSDAEPRQGRIALPEFRRSVVVRLERQGPGVAGQEPPTEFRPDRLP